MAGVADQISTLETALAAQEALRPTLGDAVVDATIAALRSQLVALHEQTRPESAPDLLYKRLQSYLPPELAEKMRAMGRIEGERKQVTVLFADISGFTALGERLDPEEMTMLINEALRELAEAVYQYEGYIDKFVGDAVMAVFGAPITHEDDPERALRAALAMRERLEGFNRRWNGRLDQPLDLHIGINSGLVIAGNIGSDLRLSYTVMGDTVNTASRLQDESQAGQIWVSRDTYRLTREAFSFTALPAITVKGKREPLAVYELQRALLTPDKTRGLKNLAAVFVGREPELARLRDIGERLRAGQGHIVTIGGEAGLGKSRLIAEWRRELGDQVYWLEGRCLAHTTSLPYGPILDLLHRYANIKGDQSEEQARTYLRLAVERFFPDNLEAHAIFANLLALRLTPEEQALLADYPAQRLRQRLFELLENLFTRLADERPMLLVIEDVHWADTTSVELIESLLPLVGRARLCIVCVFRLHPYDTPPRLLALLEKNYPDQVTSISLPPLSESSSLEMAERLLATTELREALRGVIVSKAEGNPFFVEEVIRSLIERGALVQVDGAWKPGPLLDTVSVPDNLQGLLMSRLDRLPVETKWLAQQASVIGRVFLYRVLLHIAESTDSLDSGLNRLEREELIRERTRDPEIEYIFKHALTQEAAYQSLLAPRRRELHRKVGEALEAVFANRLGEFHSIIGEHFLQGEAWEKAVEHLILAGDAAARLFANAEARQHYAKVISALDHLPDDTAHQRQRIETLLKHVAISMTAEKTEVNLERLTQVEKLLKALPDQNKRLLMRMHYLRGRIHNYRNELREAIADFQIALAGAKEFGDAEMIAVPSSMLGRVALTQGYYPRAMRLLQEAIPLLEKTGNWADWVTSRGYLALGLAERAEFASAVNEGRAGLARAMLLRNPTVLAASYGLLAITYYIGQDTHLIIETAKACQAAARQSADQFFVYYSYALLGWAEGRLGNFAAAHENMEKSDQVGQTLGQRRLNEDMFMALRGEIAYWEGDCDTALRFADQAITMSNTVGTLYPRGLAYRLRGQALAARSPAQYAAAESELATSVQIFEEGGMLLETARTHVAWGAVNQAQDKLTEAREHFDKAFAHLEVSGLRDELERVRKARETLRRGRD